MCEEIVFMNSSALNSKNKKMQRNGQKTEGRGDCMNTGNRRSSCVMQNLMRYTF